MVRTNPSGEGNDRTDGRTLASAYPTSRGKSSSPDDAGPGTARQMRPTMPTIPAILWSSVFQYLINLGAALALAFGASASGLEQTVLVLTAAVLFIGGAALRLMLPGRIAAQTAMAQGPGATVIARIDRCLAKSTPTDRSSGVFALELDHYRHLSERHDHEVRAQLLQVCLGRARAIVRSCDMVDRLDGPCFIVGLTPGATIGLEGAIQFAARLQSALSVPVRLTGQTIYPSFSVGFALSDRSDASSGEALVQAATCAMAEAQRSGPGAVRSFSRAMYERIESRKQLSQEVRGALKNGQIRPFFQPQVETTNGMLTGFETLARWHHPERGLIPPNEFLPALEEAGLMDRLGDVMVREALLAIKHWDAIGLVVPQVGVNFSTQELSDPGLAERIKDALAENGLSPDRLSIEVLETVVAGQSDDVVTRNLSRLSQMGCQLDLDDFGTGHASITAIRRFSIGRIKIDRSFVTRIDEDREQQDMVSAILTMADRLGLEALAEGVETDAEYAMLRQLGCAYVQGFGIARPMPLSETDAWIMDRAARTAEPIAFLSRSA